MELNLRVLKFLCDRFIIPKLVAVKVQGKVMYFTKEQYQKLSEHTHRDTFLFDLSKVKIGDMLLDLFQKFYLRPSKSTYRKVLKYCQDELEKEILMVIFHNNIQVVMETLNGSTSSVLGSLLKRR